MIDLESWEASSPEEKGMEPEQLRQMDQEIMARYPNVFSALVLKNGSIVHERYYRNNGPDSALSVMSVSKSILSALIGIAIEKSVFRSTEQPVLDFFPEIDVSVVDAQARRLTLRHLLTMTSGFYYTRLAGDAQPIWQRTVNSRNWVEFSLNLPVRDAMGQHFNYKNTDAFLAAACLSRASGQPIDELLNQWLFQPLSIVVPPSVSEDPQKLGMGALSLTARDMAKFGYLYLQRGVWQSFQVIPESWIIESTRRHVSNYGYFWWVDEDGFSASGAGGSLIQVLPTEQMVVVFQCKHLKRFADPRGLIRKYIL